MAPRVVRVAGCAAAFLTAAIVGALAIQRRSHVTKRLGLQLTEASHRVAGGLMLEGDIHIEKGLIQYLGGFCFGRKRVGDAGILAMRIKGAKADRHVIAGRYLMIAYMDDQVQHWQAALDNWNSLSCQSLKAISSLVTPVTSHELAGGVGINIHIKQVLEARHWHVVVALCDTEVDEERKNQSAAGVAISSKPFSNASSNTSAASIPFAYTLTGVDALSSWGAQQEGPSSCPEDYWKRAREEVWHYLVS